MGNGSMKRTMKQITSITLFGTAVSAVFYWRFGWRFLLPIMISMGTTFYHLGMRLTVGNVINVMFHNKMDYNKKWFQIRKFEEKLYKKLQVKKWKKHMPTYEPQLFSMEIHTPAEIAQAMCEAEIVHEVIIVLSFVPVIVGWGTEDFLIFLITSMLAAAFDSIFVIMQRYNRPRILRLKKKGKIRKCV